MNFAVIGELVIRIPVFAEVDAQSRSEAKRLALQCGEDRLMTRAGELVKEFEIEEVVETK